MTAEIMGNQVERVYDVGVAGIHRLFDKLDLIRNANVVIVVAGMEGALASVVGGLVERPVIAVLPVSVTALTFRGYRHFWACSTAVRPVWLSLISITVLERGVWQVLSII